MPKSVKKSRKIAVEPVRLPGPRSKGGKFSPNTSKMLSDSRVRSVRSG